MANYMVILEKEDVLTPESQNILTLDPHFIIFETCVIRNLRNDLRTKYFDYIGLLKILLLAKALRKQHLVIDCYLITPSIAIYYDFI